MAKTYQKRPALHALPLLDYVQLHRNKFWFVGDSPVMILLEGIRVRQRWLRTNRKHTKVTRNSARTYLRKGIILVPKWQEVNNWEIKYLLERSVSLLDSGILEFEGKHYRLTYMQVDDMDHAFRQPLHVLDQYFEKHQRYPSDFLERFQKILDIGRITITIADRFLKVRTFRRTFKKNLAECHQTLFDIIDDNEWLENLKTRRRVIHKIKDIISLCKAIKWKPVYRRLYFAGRSLELAIKYLGGDNPNLKRAKERMKSGLKNLEYPKPQ